jgi:hypothetical protein
MSYLTLPLLIFLTFLCWIFTMAAAAGAMSGGDACVAAGNPGGPDATISTILHQLPLRPKWNNVPHDLYIYECLSHPRSGTRFDRFGSESSKFCEPDLAGNFQH